LAALIEFFWNLYNLTPDVIKASVVSVFAFVLGNLYRAKIDGSIKSRHDKELEELKSKLRLNEDEQIRERANRDAELISIRGQLLALRSTKMSNLSDKKLEALVKIWGYTVDNAAMLNAASFASRIKFENALDVSERGDVEGMKLRSVGETLWKLSGLDSIKYDSSVDKVRPLVSPLVWALFSAYRSALVQPVLLLTALKTGVGSKLIADPKPVIDLVKSVLPHYEKLFDDFGATAFPSVLDEIREKLLGEITKSLDDPSGDDEDANRAAQILAAVNKVEESRLAKKAPFNEKT
jgi:hypothetical protein